MQLTLETIKQCFALVEEYNVGKLKPTEYFEQVKALTSLKFSVCGTCAEEQRKAHSDIQIMLWRALQELKPHWALDYTFNHYRLNTEHFRGQLSIIDDRIVQSNINNLRQEMTQVNYNRSNYTMAQVQEDIAKLNEVLLIKRSPLHFISDKEVSEKGMTIKDIIKFLLDKGYSPTVITQVVKSSRQYVHKIIKELTGSDLDAVKPTEDGEETPAGDDSDN